MSVPDRPEVVFIPGDGIGPEVMFPAIEAVDAAVRGAYGGGRAIRWTEAWAGKRAMAEHGSPLPEPTLAAIRRARVALKGPLETPVGGGIRSLNVALRKILDLYACVRPVRYYPGVPSPMRHPERVDLVLFRENTEDVYAGYEWQEGTPEALRVIRFLNQEMACSIPEDSGVGIKPMSVTGSKRLIRMAIRYALDRGRRSVTLVHKGNIMKYTEGAFRRWGYEVAAREFSEHTITEAELRGREHGSDYDGVTPPGAVVVNDRIADAMFQELILRPERYDVLALSNLNGDYMSDAAAALVGGLGLAPGANLGDEYAVFEATHGTAPDIAGQGRANPGSLMLSGAMMLRHLGWEEAADRLEGAVTRVLAARRLTPDLAPQVPGAEELDTAAFGRAVAAEAA
ncbi:NADP-dependent isocitrate dehydrogenase [Deferrisoma camini]|uniref:NADP-dependent isocitrate dehydrogenase n=1 Tax=Deferrisoma camini TaxID=1035120 RepID=UPI00046D5EAC|nr:NADP-dependent isocitrate dehydrogenase [Deferrisoma camini]